MAQQFAILFVVLLCGCATGSRITLDHYRWAPEHFDLTLSSADWRYVSSLTSNGEHHEFYERRFKFLSGQSEEVGTSSYLLTRTGVKPATVEEVFSNVTNFLSQSYFLSVVIVQRTDVAITWEWSGTSKTASESQSGVEKIIKGKSGLYRLRYANDSSQLSPQERQIWIPRIRDAQLAPRSD